MKSARDVLNENWNKYSRNKDRAPGINNLKDFLLPGCRGLRADIEVVDGDRVEISHRGNKEYFTMDSPFDDIKNFLHGNADH